MFLCLRRSVVHVLLKSSSSPDVNELLFIKKCFVNLTNYYVTNFNKMRYMKENVK